MNNTDSDRFLGMGLPWFYMLATGAGAFSSFLFVRKNTENAFQDVLADPASYRAKLLRVGTMLVACVANIVLANFLFFSAAAPYALLNTLLTLFVSVVIFHPSRPEYASRMTGAFVLWTAILCGIVFGSDGILGRLSSDRCKSAYGSYADKMCVDGWLTFTVFCGILLIGCNFLLSLLLIEVAISDSTRGSEALLAEGQYSSIDGGYGGTDSAPAVPQQQQKQQQQQDEAAYTPVDDKNYERIPDDE